MKTGALYSPDLKEALLLEDREVHVAIGQWGVGDGDARKVDEYSVGSAARGSLHQWPWLSIWFWVWERQRLERGVVWVSDVFAMNKSLLFRSHYLTIGEIFEGGGERVLGPYTRDGYSSCLADQDAFWAWVLTVSKAVPRRRG